MWGRKRKAAEAAAPEAAPPGPLKEAVRKTRIEIAEKSSVVVDLRDAELARLELLNEALDPLFNEIAAGRRSVRPRHQSRAIRRGCGSTPSPHVVMGARQAALPFRAGHPLRPQGAGGIERHHRDRRGGHPLRAQPASSSASGRWPRTKTGCTRDCTERASAGRRRRGWRMVRAFLFGLIAGCVALFAVLWIVASRLPH